MYEPRANPAGVADLSVDAIWPDCDGRMSIYCLSFAGPPVIAQRGIRSGGDWGAPSPSCSTDVQVKSQHVAFKQERSVEKVGIPKKVGTRIGFGSYRGRFGFTLFDHAGTNGGARQAQ